MPISDLTDADIDSVYAMISPAHGIDTLKENRRAQLAEQERAGRISIEVVFGESPVRAGECSASRNRRASPAKALR